ncbi:MAG: phosphoglucosamine mutase [Proteobacteria bacterium]|nr:phosphoglucosamine mutase [Pseudomonadota bacterium]
MGKLFGTDGIRGVANEYPMLPEIAFKVGRAIAYIFRNHDRTRHKILIGKDTRLSGYMLETALASGICSMGGDCVLVGPIPTPGIAFLTQSIRADAGVVISASHNPFYDNGIKIFSRDGFKLSDELEEKIEKLCLGNEIDNIRPTNKEIGKAHRIEDAAGRYISYLKTTFPKEYTLEGIKIVVDCANGAFYKIAPKVFEELGANVIPVGVNPDGENINEGCGALYPEHLSKHVLESGANLGIALDGDGDRVIFCDEKGRILNGDKILAILAKHMLRTNRLKKKTIVATIMSNMALDDFMEGLGGKVIKVPVGDRNVVEALLKEDLNLGGEQSGHIIALDYATTGDGVIAGLQVLNALLTEGKPLSELSEIIEPYPQVISSIRVKEKNDFMEIEEIRRAINSAEEELRKNKGRLNIRYSGTEPKIRIMIECKDERIMWKWNDLLKEVISKNLCGE